VGFFAIAAENGVRLPVKAVTRAEKALSQRARAAPKDKRQIMADIERGNRPLSHHLQIYRPQLTSATSIFTRVTGNALILGAVLIAWWFVAAAVGPEAYARADWWLTSWLGDLIMFLSLWALWYHFLAGIRHLMWDNGYGLELKTAEKLGLAVIAGSGILTILTALIV